MTTIRGITVFVLWLTVLVGTSGSSTGTDSSNRTQALALRWKANTNNTVAFSEHGMRALSHSHNNKQTDRHIISLAAAKRHKELVSLALPYQPAPTRSASRCRRRGCYPRCPRNLCRFNHVSFA